MKKCTKCHTMKNLSEYHKHNGASDGLQTACKTCRNVKDKQPTKYSHLGEKEANRARQIFYKYKLTLEEYDKMLSNPCDSCGDTAEVIDHDHTCCPTVRTCGKCIRGVLCRLCNLLEGKISANEDKVIAIMEYLERYKNKDATPLDNRTKVR